jgi:excinuclease ABC subunit C
MITCGPVLPGMVHRIKHLVFIAYLPFYQKIYYNKIMKSQDLKEYNIPDEPGVYLFTINGKIAYIGRATSLKDRTKSYFASDLVETRGKLIEDMVQSANGLKWQKTDTVLEAIILEASLIKKYKPYYNTKEKDDKSFNYLVISNEEFPVLYIVRARDLEENKTKIKIKYEFGLLYQVAPCGLK